MTWRRSDQLVIRRATAADATGIGDVWLSSWRATFDFPPGHPDDDVRRWLATELVPRHETWVAADPAEDGRVVALMALSDTKIEQLYVAPEWIGHGIGRRLLDLAKTRRPSALELYCFQANRNARRFYERHGFVPVAFGDGSGNEERQPDVLYRWQAEQPDQVEQPDQPSVSAGSAPDAVPTRSVESADGTHVAVFVSGRGAPLVLVHGTAADHTTFRAIAPMLAAGHTIHAIDRRGRGASGDTPPYAIEREFEDVAAVADALAAEAGVPVDVVGHSYGGRCALGAALLTGSIRRVVSYEGAPTPPGVRYGDAALAEELTALGRAGKGEELIATFLARVVGMDDEALAAYRANPVWPRRVAAAHTIPRELAAEGGSTRAGLDALGRVRQPVMQILGGESLAAFGEATHALDERLPDGRIVRIPGAKHAAHHTHPAELVEAVETFLGEP